jgi:hypothetical protein
MIKFISYLFIFFEILISQSHSSEALGNEDHKRIYIFKMSEDEKFIKDFTSAYILSESIRKHPETHSLWQETSEADVIIHNKGTHTWVVIETNFHITSCKKGQVFSGNTTALSLYLTREYECPPNTISSESNGTYANDLGRIRYFCKDFKEASKDFTSQERTILGPFYEGLVFSQGC